MGGDTGPRPGSGAEPDPAHLPPEVLAELLDAELLDAELLDRAPDVPEEVTARIAAALRAAPHPGSPPGSHTVSRPQLTRGQWAGFVVGLCAVATAVILGAIVLTRDPGPVFPSGPTAAKITVERPAASDFPVSDADLRALLSQRHDLGPLADPQRRASCLAGLGYSPGATVLGGRTLEVFGRPGVLLLVPAGTTDQFRAVVVDPTCGAAHTGLMAETVVPAS